MKKMVIRDKEEMIFIVIKSIRSFLIGVRSNVISQLVNSICDF